jgi:PAS domain S-box-containing protein
MQPINDQKSGNNHSDSGFLMSVRTFDEFHQILIDCIPQPCFFIPFRTPDKFIVNQPLVKFLNYSSSNALYKNTADLFKFFSKKDLPKIKKDLKKISDCTPIKHRRYRLIRNSEPYLNYAIVLKQLSKKEEDTIFGYFGTLSITEKGVPYQIDKSILGFFNDDRYLDEVIVIMDFKGNILSANRKYFIIDFYSDLSLKKKNLFKVIDKSYQKKLRERLAELKKGIATPPTEYKLVREDNNSAYIEIYSKPVIYRRHNVIVSLIRDISARKEMEKKLLYTIVQTEEKERHRFARDLHDELGPFLSCLKLYLNELATNDTDIKKKALLIEYLHQMIDVAVDKIRTVTSNLMPQNLIEIGLSGSIEKMIEKFNQTKQVHILLETEGKDSGIEPSLVITFHRIILELINNSIKHAESDNIRIKMIFQKKFARLIYMDDGKGFDLGKALLLNKGIGLKSIINRIELYRGSYKFTRQPRGVRYDLYFPLK